MDWILENICVVFLRKEINSLSFQQLLMQRPSRAQVPSSSVSKGDALFLARHSWGCSKSHPRQTSSMDTRPALRRTAVRCHRSAVFQIRLSPTSEHSVSRLFSGSMNKPHPFGTARPRFQVWALNLYEDITAPHERDVLLPLEPPHSCLSGQRIQMRMQAEGWRQEGKHREKEAPMEEPSTAASTVPCRRHSTQQPMRLSWHLPLVFKDTGCMHSLKKTPSQLQKAETLITSSPRQALIVRRTCLKPTLHVPPLKRHHLGFSKAKPTYSVWTWMSTPQLSPQHFLLQVHCCIQTKTERLLNSSSKAQRPSSSQRKRMAALKQ